jgi:hypothetical protein
MSTQQQLDELAWFDDSPDTGDPSCICSYCGRLIDEDQLPLRMFGEGGKKEARLCEDCQGLLLSITIPKET